MFSPGDLPKPDFVTGGCLCGAIRYHVQFPKDHDFSQNSYNCQCTQCRRNTGGLFFQSVGVPKSALQWRSSSSKEDFAFKDQPTALKHYSTKPGTTRSFCAECGGFILWFTDEGETLSFAVGTIDPLFLVGPGYEGGVGRQQAEESGWEVPERGFGALFAGGYGKNFWCCNEIKGVTDGLPICGMGRGKRYEEE